MALGFGQIQQHRQAIWTNVLHGNKNETADATVKNDIAVVTSNVWIVSENVQGSVTDRAEEQIGVVHADGIMRVAENRNRIDSEIPGTFESIVPGGGDD